MTELPIVAERIIKAAAQQVQRGENAEEIFTSASQALAEMGLTVEEHITALARLAEAVRSKETR